MTPQRWSQIKAVFHGALDRPAEARAAWLLEECGDDTALRAEAERLLRSHDTLGAFLDAPLEMAPEDLVLAAPPGADADAVWSAGHRVREFEIVRPLGRGGMGVVYLATDRDLHRYVALKSLPAAMANSPELRERLKREAIAAASISDPAVATVYAFVDVEGHPLLASEYVDGRTLRALIEDGPIDVPSVRRIATSIARGLRAAHEKGVIHRDLKPENIMVAADGSAKIVDFGIAWLEGPNGTRHTKLTQAGAMIGTPAYMAPELLVGGGIPDARGDIYSFGVILTEMLTGRHPLTRGTHTPSDAALQRIADRARDLDRDRRFPNASELVLALENPITDPGPAPVDPNAAARVRSARYWWDFHQGAAAVSYAAMLIPAWFARGQIGGIEGRSFFIATAVAALVASMLRLHLWFMSRQHATELAWARRRSAPWIRTADVMLVVSLVIGAGLVAAQSSIDVVLLVLAVGIAVAFAFIEPSTARAAGLD
jgi:serine/threonine protein kinase